jgi:hypothetical protein
VGLKGSLSGKPLSHSCRFPGEKLRPTEDIMLLQRMEENKVKSEYRSFDLKPQSYVTKTREKEIKPLRSQC